jgi:hypothetical protein
MSNPMRGPIARFCVVLCALVTSTSTLFVSAQAGPVSQREKYNFNAGWKVLVGNVVGAEAETFDDSAWKSVTTPSAWNEDDAFRKDIKDLPTGIAWYRKHFKLPANSAGKKIFLEFEGIRHGGEFYLNGKWIGRHENGVMAFGFDLTDQVRAAPADNVLAVRIDNSWNYHEKATGSTYQWSDRNFYANYGGINKNVYLHVTDKLYQTLPLYSNLKTTGVYIYGQEFDVKSGSAKITAESQVKNEYPSAQTFSYEVMIEDLNGKPVKTFSAGPYTLTVGETKTISASATVGGLKFWCWGYGYLYNVYTSLKVGSSVSDVVKTRTGFRKTEFGSGVVKLNDRVIQVKGYAQRTTNEWPAIGLSVPAWVSDFSNQMMVEGGANLVRWMHVTPWKQDVESCDRVGLMESVPAGDSEKDADGRHWEQRLELMRDAIIYNRNNPSVIFWESGNKGVSEEHMRQMKALRDRYDPHGGRAAGSREMLDSKVAEYGGEMLYINKSAGTPFWAMEYSRDEALRKYWDDFSPPFHKDGDGPLYNNQDASIYNRNQNTQVVEDVVRWYDYWRERPGTGKRVSAGGVNIIFSDSNTHHRGAENYRRSGEVDAMRIAKDAYFANQVMWDGWVDVNERYMQIVGHWNYAPGTRKNVYVVSGADRVQLFLNERSLGVGERSSHFLFTFKDIEWQPGYLEAKGYYADGLTMLRAWETTGPPVAIRLTPHTGPSGFKADGADLALVDVEVVDAEGNRCPTALNMLDFTLSGPAEWRGGIAQGPDNYILAKSLPVEGGINRVIIRAATQGGKIVVEARSVGLKPATLELVSRPVAIENGLSLSMPADGLPSFLNRGPTPVAETVTVTRNALSIASVTAGANSEIAAKSFDDNEITAWSNDGKLATAWIKYDLARAAVIDEVTFKLGGWRTRSYPIRISIDDKVVFTGETTRSLGYVTISFPPTVGRTLKIQLISDAKDESPGNVTELAQPLAASGGDRGSAKGLLEIVEIEIYELLTLKG